MCLCLKLFQLFHLKKSLGQSLITTRWLAGFFFQILFLNKQNRNWSFGKGGGDFNWTCLHGVENEARVEQMVIGNAYFWGPALWVGTESYLQQSQTQQGGHVSVISQEGPDICRLFHLIILDLGVVAMKRDCWGSYWDSDNSGELCRSLPIHVILWKNFYTTFQTVILEPVLQTG